MKLLRKAESVFDRIMDAFGVAAGIILVAIMLAVSVKVVFRYFLVARLMGVDEISEVALLYITFLGTAWLLKREGHVSIDIIYIRFGEKTRAILTAVTSVIGMIVSVCLTYYGVLATLDTWSRKVVTPTILEIPRALILCVIPLGSALLVIQFLRRAWYQLRAGKDKEEKTVEA